MRSVSGRTGRLLIVVLLLAATAAFGIGVATERSEAGGHSEPVAAAHSEAGEESGTEAPAPAEDAHAPETFLGIEMESTRLVVVGIVISLAAAAAVWLWGERRRVLEVVALFCLGFALLDAIEAARKIGDEATIAAFALAALVLHTAAGASAAALARRVDPRAAPS